MHRGGGKNAFYVKLYQIYHNYVALAVVVNKKVICFMAKKKIIIILEK